MKVNESGVSVMLKYARMTKDPNGKLFSKDEVAERPSEVLMVPAEDVVQIFARDVKMNPEDLGPIGAGDMGFETDAAISRGRGG